MKKWKIWTGILLIFCAGISIGAVGSRLIFRHQVIAMLNEGPPAIQRLISKRLTRQLDLNPAQQARIEHQVFITQQRILTLRSRYQPEAAAIIKDGVEDIRKELTPQQQQKLDRIYQQLQRRFSPYHAL